MWSKIQKRPWNQDQMQAQKQKSFRYKITISDRIEQTAPIGLIFIPSWIEFCFFSPLYLLLYQAGKEVLLPASHFWYLTPDLAQLSLSLNFSFFAHLYFPHQCLWIPLSLMMMMAMWPWRDCDCGSGRRTRGTQEHSVTHCCQATRWEPGSNKHDLLFFLQSKTLRYTFMIFNLLII